LYRERIKLHPSLPRNMKILAESLLAYGPLKRFYKDSVTCNNGKIALIFTTDELLHELGKSTELYVDGTFNVSSAVQWIRALIFLHIFYIFYILLFSIYYYFYILFSIYWIVFQLAT